MQPQWDCPMDVPEGTSAEDVRVGQWEPGIDFGEFTRRTLQKNYHSEKRAPYEAATGKLLYKCTRSVAVTVAFSLALEDRPVHIVSFAF
eukprot:scaffold2738_cov366-Prasinococcus_capsulatus_cf.AAC.3